MRNLRSQPSNFRSRQVMDGSVLVTTATLSLLFGCPPEVSKALDIMDASFPDAFVMPTYSYQGEQTQMEVEFPFLKSLFILGRFFQGKKFHIICTTTQMVRLKEILITSLLDEPAHQLMSWGIPPEIIEMQRRITEFRAIKVGDRLATIDDLVEFFCFENGKVVYQGYVIEERGENLFLVHQGEETLAIDLNFFGPQRPPMPIVLADLSTPRPTFGLKALSKCTTGFDPSGYTAKLLLWINSMAIIIDGIPWGKETLRQAGINPAEIQATIMTHRHGDHSQIIDMIINEKKVTIITTREIFRGFVKKTALLLSRPDTDVLNMINHIEVVPGKPFFWYGARFDFFRTVHPLFTIGFEVSLGGKIISYSGDTEWGDNLDECLSKGVISQAYYDTVDSFFRRPADVKIVDAGGGMIHPNPVKINEEFHPNVKKSTYLTHCPKLPDGTSGLRLITPGQNWVLIPDRKMRMGDVNVLLNCPILSGIDRRWENTILSHGTIHSIRPKKAVLRQDLPGNDFYLILNGTFSVSIDGNEVARLASGDFFGEISLMKNVTCTATVTAENGGRILSVPRGIFLELVRSTEIGERLKRIHRVRPILMNCGLLKNLPSHVINDIAQEASVKEFKAGEVIVHQGEKGEELYLIEDGRVRVYLEYDGILARDIATLYRNQFFGEMALLGDGSRNASVMAEKDTRVLVLHRDMFRRLINTVPVLYYHFGIMAEERSKSI